jgi:hypothetical protein
MTAKISPRPGFEWSAVNWGAPDQPRTDRCSYCEASFPDDDEDPGFIPLILSNAEGWVAEFCDDCQRRWWGIERYDDDDDRTTDEGEVSQ